MPEAYVCHQTRGRVRIKVPARRGDAAFFLRLKDRLYACEGVSSVESNPITGSVLIAHETAPDAIVAYAQAEQLFRVDNDAHPVQAHPRATERLNALDAGSRSATSGTVDLTRVISVSLLGLGIYQLAQGEVMVPAITLFWYAFHTVRGHTPA